MDAGIPDAADASVADDGAVESDANVPDSDAGEPDGEAMVSCVPSEWSCIGLDQAGYCNGAGDGFVHTVPCEVGCADGFCDVFRPVGDLCGAIRNGARGELVGGTDCPAILSSLDVGYEYTMWLDAGDEVVVEAEALSPLARAQIHLDHECVAGACATEAVSMPGGTAQARHTAPRSRQIRVRVKAGPGQMIGARVRYEIELIPASVRPTLPPPTCTADQATCPNANRVEYCSGDGQELRAFNCAETPDAVPGTCTAGACDHGPGPSCAHAQPIVRPPSDQLGLGASLNGMFNDIDPGPDCFGIGQSGPDRIWRLAMNAGERIRLRMVSENLGHRIHSLYILRGSCGSPTTSCVAGGLGYRFTDSRGRSRVNPELDYTAPADETIYIVADVEGRVSDDELRTLSIRWTGSCTDGVENGDETDIDCGGSCGGCGDGQMCRVDGDCESRRCGELTAGRCGRPFGCGDGVLGPLEFCDDGNTVDNDFCSNGCRTATCDDGIQNGDETTIDGGGYCLRSPKDTCRRAEEVVLERISLGDPHLGDYFATDNLAGAGSDRTASCGAPGGDHAYRFVLTERSQLNFYVAPLDPAGRIDSTRPVTLSVTRDCSGPEVACVAGPGLTQTNRLLDPGIYILWVNDQGAGGDYEIGVNGSVR